MGESHAAEYFCDPDKCAKYILFPEICATKDIEVFGITSEKLYSWCCQVLRERSGEPTARNMKAGLRDGQEKIMPQTQKCCSVSSSQNLGEETSNLIQHVYNLEYYFWTNFIRQLPNVERLSMAFSTSLKTRKNTKNKMRFEQNKNRHPVQKLTREA